jgi:hypothetical protein
MTGIYESPPAGSPWINGEPGIPNGEPDPTKVCRRCSVQSQTVGTHCPHCGASFIRKSPISKRASLVAGSGVVMLLAGVLLLLVVRHNRDEDSAKRQHEAALRASSSSAAAASASASASSAAADVSAAAAAATQKAKEAKDAAARSERKRVIKVSVAMRKSPLVARCRSPFLAR